jgi:hypothetical protein
LIDILVLNLPSLALTPFVHCAAIPSLEKGAANPYVFQPSS